MCSADFGSVLLQLESIKSRDLEAKEEACVFIENVTLTGKLAVRQMAASENACPFAMKLAGHAAHGRHLQTWEFVVFAARHGLMCAG